MLAKPTFSSLSTPMFLQHGIGRLASKFLSIKKFYRDQLGPDPSLQREQYLLLRSRGFWWLTFLATMAALISKVAIDQKYAVPQNIFFSSELPKLNITYWILGLFLFISLNTIILRALPSTKARGIKTFNCNLILITTLTATAFWWTLGIYSLSPELVSSHFAMTGRTFLFLTSLGSVATIVMLTSNWKAFISVTLIGCFLPCAFYLSKSANSFVAMMWLTGQITAFIAIGILLHLDQRQLLKQKIQLKSLSRQKGRLLESFSHDMMQSLTALGFYLEGLNRRSPDGESSELIDGAIVQRQSLQSMLESARDLADAEAGQLPCHPREIALQPLLRNVVSTYRPSAEQNGVRLDVHAPSIIVRSDPELLDRIIGNLVSNAIKYSKSRDESHVLVGCRIRGRNVQIGVYDNGVGIPNSRLAEIFEEYVQLDNPERDRHKGLGLGLAIVRALAKLLKHRIHVSSKVGDGSVFFVEVPMVGRVPLELQTANKLPVALKDSSVQLHGLTVALVDDEPWQRHAMTIQLRDWGCQVIAASSAATLATQLSHLDGKNPDILVTDQRLRQHETGFDVIKAARQIHPNLPAVIWTANLPSKVRENLKFNNVNVISKGKYTELANELIKAKHNL